MATGTAGTVAREYHSHQVHYLRKDFTYANAGQVLTVGVLPAGALILRNLSGVQINVAFTAATNHQLDIGTTDNDDLYATNLELNAIDFIEIDEAVSMAVSVDTTITATPDLTGASNTAGSGTVVIAYLIRDGV
jgi:hypothetical protein